MTKAKGAHTHIKNSAGDRVFMCLVYMLLLLGTLIVLYPLVFVVSASFSDPVAVSTGKVVLWPVRFTLRGYSAVFGHAGVINGYKNSMIYLVAGTAINLVMTVMAAYPLSHKAFVGKRVVNLAFVFTMYISGGMIPGYLLLMNIGILNTRWALLLPGAISVYNMILCRSYMSNAIPGELYDAVQIDGASDLGYLLRVVLPLSGPILAVLTLYYGVAHWNSYFSAMIYLNDASMYPLQLVLRSILVMNQVDYTMIEDIEALERLQGLVDLLKYALIVVASVPLMLLYPFIQRYFVSGIMIGAVKG